MRKTKIICTLGPSTDKEGVLRDLIANGMNVARFNFSHGSHEEHLGRLEKLKALREELVNYPVYVALGDGSVIETREDLIALGAEKIFTPELKDSMANADLSELSPSMAGFTLYSTGDGPNITFNVQNGVLGISGINY